MPSWLFLFVCSSSSYEERLNSLVLKEEFSHFVDEVNHSIAVMTAAGQGKIELVYYLLLSITINGCLLFPTSQHAVFPFLKQKMYFLY